MTEATTRPPSYRRRIRLPRGKVYRARFCERPWFASREPKGRGRLGQGIRYEQLVHLEFLQRYPGYLYSMWLEFEDAEDLKYCQLDGLIVNPWQGILTIIEAKYQHTNDAYVQLFRLYLPVLRAAVGGQYQISCCEVCKWFDPATLTDAPAQLCRHPELASPGLFNIHIWRP